MKHIIQIFDNAISNHAEWIQIYVNFSLHIIYYADRKEKHRRPTKAYNNEKFYAFRMAASSYKNDLIFLICVMIH